MTTIKIDSDLSHKSMAQVSASSDKPRLASIFTTASKRVREGETDNNNSEGMASSSSIVADITTTTSTVESTSENTVQGPVKKVKLDETTSANNNEGAVATTSKVTTTTTQTMIQPKPLFKWLTTNPSRLLHGTFGQPHYSSKVACFDVDGTLITTRSGARFPQSPQDWIFWCGKGNVQDRLTEYYNNGYSIVFVSNQCYAPHTKPHQNFKSKMPLIGRSLGGIPFRVLAATAKDVYRKPNVGMWTELNNLYTKQGFPLDKASSFYVGDAAGRQKRTVLAPNKKGSKDLRQFGKDHSDSDKMWAYNVGIPFYTPEEFFWDRKDEKDAIAKA